MDLQLSGLNVLVTGGSSGIGAAIVQEFLNEGSNVAFCSRSQDKINQALSKLHNPKNCKIWTKALNVTDIDGFNLWLKELGMVDIFVPNVSALSFEDTFKPNEVENVLSGDLAPMVEVDLNSTVKLIDLVVPYLEKSKLAAITYIGSVGSSFPTPVMPIYGAIKAGLTHYMKTLSKKLISKNIRVNTISPGNIYVKDGFWDAVKINRPNIYNLIFEKSPMGRFGTPVEIAKATVFISSPAASFVSGANWIVDGNISDHIQC